MALCRKLDLFGRELLAVDGTRLKAVNSQTLNFTRAKLETYLKSVDERLERYLTQLDDIDRGEDDRGVAPAEALAAKIAKVRERRQVSEAMLEQLKTSGESQISLTDPDARAMVTHGKTTVGYNAQVAVDAKHKLIVEQHVTNAGSDLGLLAQTAGAAKALLGVERIDAVADMGYYKGEDIEACEENGITPYVARPQRGIAVSNGHFPRERFHYDAEEDVYRCPGGQRLDTRYHSVARGHVTVQYSNPNACAACAIKARCTGGRYRRVNRWENEAVLARLDLPMRHHDVVMVELSPH